MLLLSSYGFPRKMSSILLSSPPSGLDSANNDHPIRHSIPEIRPFTVISYSWSPSSMGIELLMPNYKTAARTFLVRLNVGRISLSWLDNFFGPVHFSSLIFLEMVQKMELIGKEPAVKVLTVRSNLVEYTWSCLVRSSSFCVFFRVEFFYLTTKRP